MMSVVSFEVTTEHTEHTEFHGKNTEYRFAYGKHGTHAFGLLTASRESLRRLESQSGDPYIYLYS
ncbi:hypothetical protein McpCs1_00830 [Methanocorpusculaceae archaeon Cs1]|uniref:Uncharacterized protein n=1 Tax=Methanorbis rubei TaxID=3028300 RepID=A0AAE4MEL4_9EURY|nr:hypothetical protein [Methanocorpusculaceae archaeon Cs1]